MFGLRNRTVRSAVGSSTQSNRSTRIDPPESSGLVSRIIWNWPDSRPVRLKEALLRHPELAGSPRARIELAIVEFNQRRQTEPDLTAFDFVREFPDIESELLDSLIVDARLSCLDELLDEGLRPAPVEPDWPEAGQTFAGFRLLEPLGRGSFSRVFLAEDTQYANRRVAVKVCRAESPEARTLADLHHSALGTVHFIRNVPEAGLLAICMPFSSRTTLMDVIRSIWESGRWPGTALAVWKEVRCRNQSGWPHADWSHQRSEAWVLNLMQTLAQGLSVSHRHDTIHCDIKPSNILITSEGQPVLVDFNVAFRSGSATGHGNIGGTLPYMAPEQLLAFLRRDSSRAIGPATDIFGLGATVYHLLTGRLPFGTTRSSAEGLREALRARCQPVTPVRQLNPAISQPLSNLIQRCLSYRIEDRPPSAGAILTELERIRNDPGRQRRFQHRSQVSRSIVAAAVLLAAAFVLQNSGSTTDPERLPGAAASQFSRLERELTAELTQGWDRFQEGDYVAAERHFATVMQLDPRHQGAAIGRARAALRLNLPETLTTLTLVLPEATPEQIALKGLCHAACDRHELSTLYLERAIAEGFDSREVRTALGYCCFRQGRYDLAAGLLEEVVNSPGPVLPQANLTLARLLANRANQNVTRERAKLTTAERMDLPRIVELIEACPESAVRGRIASQLYVQIGRSLGRRDRDAGRQWQARGLEEFARGHQLGLSANYWNQLLPVLDQELLQSPTARLFASVSPKETAPGDRPLYLIDPFGHTSLDRCLTRELARLKIVRDRPGELPVVPPWQIARAR